MYLDLWTSCFTPAMGGVYEQTVLFFLQTYFPDTIQLINS